jgi:hypothetical protein
MPAGAPIETPPAGDIARAHRRDGDAVNTGDAEQQEKGFRQPHGELLRNVGAWQRVGPYLLTPMGEFEHRREAGEMHQRDLELLEGIAELQPWPQRDRGQPGDDDTHAIADGELPQVARRQPPVLGEKTRRTENEGGEQIGMGDDAASAGGDRQAAQQADGDGGRP